MNMEHKSTMTMIKKNIISTSTTSYKFFVTFSTDIYFRKECGTPNDGFPILAWKKSLTYHCTTRSKFVDTSYIICTVVSCVLCITCTKCYRFNLATEDHDFTYILHNSAARKISLLNLNILKFINFAFYYS